MTTLDFTPAPGAAPLPRMVLAQAGAEMRGMLRNGEQLLLTMIIPVLVLVGFSLAPLLEVPGARIATTPGCRAGDHVHRVHRLYDRRFERRYGVLKRPGATPLSGPAGCSARRSRSPAWRSCRVLIVAVALGWRPEPPGRGPVLSSSSAPPRSAAWPLIPDAARGGHARRGQPVCSSCSAGRRGVPRRPVPRRDAGRGRAAADHRARRRPARPAHRRVPFPPGSLILCG